MYQLLHETQIRVGNIALGGADKIGAIPLVGLIYQYIYLLTEKVKGREGEGWDRFKWYMELKDINSDW